MGGRGSNSGMSTASLGGSGGGPVMPPMAVPLATVQVQQPPVVVPQNQPAPTPPPSIAPNTPPMGVSLSDVQKMDDKGMHDFLIDAWSVDMPQFLNLTSHTQHMIYGLGMNDKPQVVSDSQLDSLVKQGATPLYRTVNDSPMPGGITMTSDDICDMMTDGDISYIGDGAHGDGLYFSDSKSGSKLYGKPGKHPKTLRAVLNPATTRSIDEDTLRRQYDSFVKTHPRTRRALGFAAKHSDWGNSFSQFALMQGYNVITSRQYGETYYTVIDRGALIMSKTRV